LTDSTQKHQGRINKFLIVVDSSDQRINQFSLKGKLQKRICMKDVGFPTAKLEYAGIDFYNQILITDSQNHCIHKFDNDLTYITSFGSEGDNDHQFEEPKGIAIYRRFGQLFIAENSGAQYYWIGTDFSILSANEDKNYVSIEINITEPSYINADIFDDNENFVKRIAQNKFLRKAGSHFIKWNKKMGKESNKFYKENEYEQSKLCRPFKKLPKGKYSIKIIAEPSYSSRTFFEKIEIKEFEIVNYSIDKKKLLEK